MQPLEVAQAYFDAWNRHDAAGILACFEADGTYEDPAAGEVLSGKSVGGYARGLLSAFPDLAFDIESVQASGDGMVAAQWTMRGTNNGSYGGLPPTGRAVSLPGSDFIQVADGKIRSVRGYFDGRALPQQLGLQVVVQPEEIGPFQFGTSIAVRSGKTDQPGAVSVTVLRPRDEEEQLQIRDLSRAVAVEMQDMPGFIGFVGLTVGGRMMTLTTWQNPDDPQQLLQGGNHKGAMAKFFGSELGAGGITSVWTPQRIDPAWARCAACGEMNNYEEAGGTCDCGAALAAPDFW